MNKLQCMMIAALLMIVTECLASIKGVKTKAPATPERSNASIKNPRSVTPPTQQQLNAAMKLFQPPQAAEPTPSTTNKPTTFQRTAINLKNSLAKTGIRNREIIDTMGGKKSMQAFQLADKGLAKDYSPNFITKTHKLTNEDMINDSVSHKANEQPSTMRRIGNAISSAPTALKNTYTNAMQARAQTKATAQQNKLQRKENIQNDLALEITNQVSAVKEIAGVKELLPETVNKIKSDTTRGFLKNQPTSTLMQFVTSSNPTSNSAAPISRSQAWSALTSKMADAVGLTRLSNSSSRSAINKQVAKINNWGSRQLDKIMGERKMTSEAIQQSRVSQIVNGMNRQYEALAGTLGIKQQTNKNTQESAPHIQEKSPNVIDGGLVKTTDASGWSSYNEPIIDVTVTPEKSPAQSGSLSRNSSTNSLDSFADFHSSSNTSLESSSSGKTSKESLGTKSSSSQTPLSRNASKQSLSDNGYGQFVELAGDGQFYDVAF